MQLALNCLAIASDAAVLGLTIARTIGIRIEAYKLGLKTQLSSLLLRDGT